MQSQVAPFQLAGRLARSSSPALRRLLRQSHNPEVISLAGGFPPPETFPVEALRAAVDRTLSSRPESALQYSVAEGREQLRERIADQASARLARAVSPAQVIVTNGAQQATCLVAAALLDDDADAAFESPGYVGALQAVRLFARRLLPVPVDGDGARVDVLADLLRRRHPPRLFYTNPTFQNPTGRTMTSERRDALAELAESGAVQVVEDDAYGTLSFSGDTPVPVAARSERVLFVGTFSKLLFPGFRLGYVIAPPGLADWLAQVKQAMDLHTSTWAQTVMCQLLSDPTLLQRQTRLAAALSRSSAAGLAAALSERFGAALRFELPAGGMFIWARLGGPGVDTERLLPVAVEQRVTFVPGAPFFCGRAEPHALRLSFVTVEPDEARVAAGRLHGAYLLHLAERAAPPAWAGGRPAGARAVR
jgi:2-aminoadipate transaminase